MRNAAIFILCFSAVIGGCGGGGGGDSAGGTKVRFVFVAPTLSSATISSDDTSIGSVNYPGALGYKDLSSGSHEIKVKSDSSTYVDASTNFSSDTNSTYVIYGSDTFTSYLVTSDSTAGGSTSSGKFKLRAINVATGLGPLDLYLLAPSGEITGATPSVTGIGYPTVQSFAEYSADSLRVVVTPNGSKQIIYDSGTQNFAAGSAVTVVIYSTASGKLAGGALLQNDSNGSSTFIPNPSSRFKLMQAAPDVANASVLVDDSIALSGVPYATATSYGIYPAGDRTIQIQASAAPGAPLYSQSHSLQGGWDYSLVAYSVSGTGAAGLYVLPDNNLPPTSGKAKLRIVNAISDGGSYDAYLSFSKYVSNLTAGAGSAYQQIDAGSYSFSFNLAGTTIQATSLSPQIYSGHVYTLYLIGRAGAALATVTQDY